MLGRLASGAFLLALGTVCGLVLAAPHAQNSGQLCTVRAPVILSWEEVCAAINSAVGREVREPPDEFDLRLELKSHMVDWYIWQRERTVVVSGWEFSVYGADTGEKAPDHSVDVMETTYMQGGRGKPTPRVVRLSARPHPE